MVSHYTEALIAAAIELASVSQTSQSFTRILTSFQKYSKELASHGGLQIYPDIWPFLPSIFDNSPPSAWPRTKGQANGPLVINFKWVDEANDSFWLDAIETVTTVLHELALLEGCTTIDTPVYYNLALEDVPPSSIYRGNMEKLIGLRHEYDPSSLMNRTGGFRIQ